MRVIELENVSRAFTVVQPDRPAPYPAGGPRRRRPVVHRRTRRGDGLHRPERRRQVHHDQDAHRHPGPHRRLDPGRRRRPVAAPAQACQADRRGLRPAHHPVVGPAVEGLVRRPAEDVRRTESPPPREPGDLRRTPGPRRPARRARSARSRWASGCAATSRPRCCTTRRSSTWTSRRSDWTSSARRGCASSWPRSTRNAGPPSSSPPTTWTTSRPSAPE